MSKSNGDVDIDAILKQIDYEIEASRTVPGLDIGTESRKGANREFGLPSNHKSTGTFVPKKLPEAGGVQHERKDQNFTAFATRTSEGKADSSETEEDSDDDDGEEVLLVRLIAVLLAASSNLYGQI